MKNPNEYISKLKKSMNFKIKIQNFQNGCFLHNNILSTKEKLTNFDLFLKKMVLFKNKSEI